MFEWLTSLTDMLSQAPAAAEGVSSGLESFNQAALPVAETAAAETPSWLSQQMTDMGKGYENFKTLGANDPKGFMKGMAMASALAQLGGGVLGKDHPLAGVPAAISGLASGAQLAKNAEMTAESNTDFRNKFITALAGGITPAGQPGPTNVGIKAGPDGKLQFNMTGDVDGSSPLNTAVQAPKQITAPTSSDMTSMFHKSLEENGKGLFW